MAKKINISLSETERENVRKVLEICNLLREYRGKDLKYDEVVTATKAIRTLLGDKIVGSLLERVGLRNMRFLNTARPIIATSDYNIVGSNYTITNVRLPLLEKKVRDGQLVEVIPLYKQPDKIKQSAAIDVAEWYSRTIVYLGNDLSLDRQETLQLLDGYAKGDKKAIDICGNMMANSGIYHMGLKLIFASMPIVAMAEQIIYEVAESLHIEGILDITDENELALKLQLGNELFVQSLSIRNYKLFEDKPSKYAFNDRFTVLIGDNAKGKTTILDAIRIILDTILPAHVGTSKKSIVSGIKEIYPLNVVHRKFIKEKVDFIFPVEIYVGSRYGQLKRTRPNYDKRATRKMHIELSDRQDRLPLIVYCGVERTRPIEKKKTEEKLSNTRYDGYADCLNMRASTSYLKLWLRELQQSAKRNKKAEALLESFVNAVCSCLKSENIIDIKYVYQKKNAKGGKMSVVDDIVLIKQDSENSEKYEEWFSSLSAGYKVMVSMIANLAYRCIVLNPQLGKDAITGTSGIVLIDEIDMHLHPLWQRHVVEDLMRCFPKVQFIATTHSPFIIQSLKKEQIKSLANDLNIAKNPTEANIDTSIRVMGIDNVYGKDFNDQVTLAQQFYNVLRKENVDPNELNRIHSAYVQRYGDDAVLLARMNLKETIEYKKIQL